MRKTLFALLAAALVLPASEAASRTRVTVYARPAAPVAGAVPLIAVPPLMMVYDLSIRTSCDPAVIKIGTGPGFDPKEPIVGNFLLPAIYTRCGYPVPKFLQPAMPKKRA